MFLNGTYSCDEDMTLQINETNIRLSKLGWKIIRTYIHKYLLMYVIHTYIHSSGVVLCAVLTSQMHRVEIYLTCFSVLFPFS